MIFFEKTCNMSQEFFSFFFLIYCKFPKKKIINLFYFTLLHYTQTEWKEYPTVRFDVPLSTVCWKHSCSMITVSHTIYRKLLDFIAKDDFDIKNKKKIAHTSFKQRILIANDICDWCNVKCSVMGYTVLIDAAYDAQKCLFVCTYLCSIMKPFKSSTIQEI